MKKTLALIALFTTITSSTLAQSITVYSIDASQFPKITAKFNIRIPGPNTYDSIPQRGLKKENFSLTDSSIKTIIDFSCPETYQRKISLAMSFDISSSMQEERNALDSSKFYARNIIRGFSVNETEFALQTADSRAEIIQEFTTDTNAVFSSLNKISIGDEKNNFSEQLINEFRGVINLAKRGKNEEKIAVLFTDGAWSALRQDEINRCIDTCSKYKIKFYYVLYSGPQAETNGIISSLNSIKNYAGGGYFLINDNNYYYSNYKLSSQQIEKWLQAAGGYKQDTLTISWNGSTGCTPAASGGLGFYAKIGDYYPLRTFYLPYRRPANAVSYVEIEPAVLDFGELPSGAIREQTVKLTARVADIKIGNITSDYYSSSKCLNCNAQTLIKDQPVEFRIRYVATQDGSPSTTFFNIMRSDCNYNSTYMQFAATGGAKKTEQKNSLEIISPKGGENFSSGNFVNIEWRGTDEPVSIEYSPDGEAWQMVANKVSGKNYSWDPADTLDGKYFLRVHSIRSGPFDYSDKTNSTEPTKIKGEIRTTPGGKIILGGNKIYDYSSGRIKNIFEGQVYFSPDLIKAIHVTPQETVLLLDLDSNFGIRTKRELPIMSLDKNSYTYTKFYFNRSSTKFIASGIGYSVWDAESGEKIFQGAEEPWYGSTVAAWHPIKDEYAIKRYQNDFVITYFGSDNRERCRSYIDRGYDYPLFYSASGKFLFYQSAILTTADCRSFDPYSKVKQYWFKSEISGNDKLIAANPQYFNDIVFYETENYTEQIRIRNVEDGYAYQMKWSPDSKYLAAILSKGKCKIYDATSGQTLSVIKLTENPYNFSISWLPDSRGIIVKGPNNESRQWNLIDEDVISSPIQLTSSENIELVDVNTYPNPAEEKISLSVNNSAYEINRIYLVNLLGEFVTDITYNIEKKSSRTVEFDTREVPSGSYFIVAETSFGKKLYPLSVIH